ncbi:hypothetical protein DLREEDagrD3_20440 [Denitratisoma sp. agr-D3]
MIQPISALFSATTIARAITPRQGAATSPANTADTVTISQAARDRFAAEAAQAKSTTSASSGTKAEYDTNHGAQMLDIEAYFTPNQGQPLDLDTLPLLMPSQKNIDALSGYVNEHMRSFLSDNGIPTAPTKITYDMMGEVQLPADYPYAAEFKKALENNPVMERALRTTNALSSNLVEMNKSLPYLQEYQAASSQAEIAAVTAKYSYLFSNNRYADTIALNFTANGTLSITHDGKPLSQA